MQKISQWAELRFLIRVSKPIKTRLSPALAAEISSPTGFRAHLTRVNSSPAAQKPFIATRKAAHFVTVHPVPARSRPQPVPPGEPHNVALPPTQQEESRPRKTVVPPPTHAENLDRELTRQARLSGGRGI
jgi:hypothetical protein